MRPADADDPGRSGYEFRYLPVWNSERLFGPIRMYSLKRLCESHPHANARIRPGASLPTQAPDKVSYLDYCR
jgi:hypothetical protein